MKKKIIHCLRKWKQEKIENVISFCSNMAIIGVFLLYFHWCRVDIIQSLKDVGNEVYVAAFGVVIAAVFTYGVKRIVSMISSKLEDLIKLTPDYEEVVLNYENSREQYFVSIKNDFEIGKKKKGQICSYRDDKGVYWLPVEVIEKKSVNKPFCIEISDDQSKMYQLPDHLFLHYDENLSAHEQSKVYNNICIRVDDCQKLKDNIGVHLYTSRTTYFDSLATNRAMDYKWENGFTVRKIYTYDNKISALRESVLSNHLGANGIIRTKDDKIICIHRSREASIAKDTYTFSIGSAIKGYHLINETGEFNRDSLINAIQCVVEKETGIEKNEYDFSPEANIIAFYRDWLEGGKPQFLFYINCGLKSEVVKEKYLKMEISSVANKEMEFISVSDLKNTYFSADYVFIKSQTGNRIKSYKVVPTVAYSLYQYREYIKESVAVQKL